ncbi:MAG TPA: alpha/beta fold hydrolase [Terriglobales bacterium]|jgi:pimeloyl-ACP methyl ester carboxylesterase|nr:alpha/beta fold hydrolase [Terriglobales bacterium]
MPTVRVNEAEIYYEVRGQGRPFIFFSETACDGEIWKLHQVPEFARDHLVITHDYRGTGKSSKPSNDYTTRMFCDDAVAILDHLKIDRAIVLGHSMGGRVAQLVALEHPTRVEKLILASTGAAFPGAVGLPLTMCKEMIEWGYENYVKKHTIQVGFIDEFVKTQPERLEAFFKARLANLCPVEFYLRHVLARQSHNTSDRLKDIGAPTLVMVGELEDDPGAIMSHRASSEILAMGIPGAQFVQLPGQKHNYFASAPETAHGIIRDFLAI